MVLNFLRGNVLTITAGGLLIGPFLFAYYLLGVAVQIPVRLISPPAPDPYFHLLLPATDKNENVCKLMLGARALGYPDPVFVGWEGNGQYDGSKSHLFKITETLAYLRNLPPAADEDIVLLLDAYDVWIQLRMEVLLKRYNSVVARANQRLQKDRIHGKIYAGAEVKAKIVFGADKSCWPQSPTEPACWVIPNSTLPEHAFGPNTDIGGEWEVRRPKWLNSGTIMGPAAAVRDMLSATVDMLSAKNSVDGTNSDQYYFAEVFAEQEISRQKLRDPSWESAHEADVPKIPESKRTEYHITLDYDSEIFQILAAYENHITWMRYNETTPDSRQHATDGRMPRLDEQRLDRDVSITDPPFTGSNGKDGLPYKTHWLGLPMAINTVTGLPIPVMHTTSSKALREKWWPRMWYAGDKEFSKRLAIAAASRISSKQDHVYAQIDKIRYRPSSYRSLEFRDERQGGAWTNKMEFLEFDDVCGDYDDQLYNNMDKGWYSVGYPFGEVEPAEGEGEREEQHEEEHHEEERPEGAVEFINPDNENLNAGNERRRRS